jgi:hypothetical protein
LEFKFKLNPLAPGLLTVASGAAGPSRDLGALREGDLAVLVFFAPGTCGFFCVGCPWIPSLIPLPAQMGLVRSVLPKDVQPNPEL